MKEHIERIYEAWADFFHSVEHIGTAAEALFLWITSPFWVIPYSIYKKREDKEDGT